MLNCIVTGMRTSLCFNGRFLKQSLPGNDFEAVFSVIQFDMQIVKLTRVCIQHVLQMFSLF